MGAPRIIKHEKLRPPPAGGEPLAHRIISDHVILWRRRQAPPPILLHQGLRQFKIEPLFVYQAR